MSNRPKNKKKVVVEEFGEDEVAYRPIGRSPRDMVIFGGVILIILAFVLVPMLAFVFTSPPTPTAAQQQQAQGNEVDQQIAEYKKQLEKNSSDAMALANLGYWTNKKADSLHPDPKNPADLKKQQMALYATAEGYSRKALEVDSTYGLAREELAKSLMAQEKYDDADTVIEDGLKDAEGKLDAKDVKIASAAKAQKASLLSLGSVISAQKNDLASAITKIDQVLAIDAGNPQYYMQRGQYYLKMGNKEKAKADFETLVDIGQKTQNQQAAIVGQLMLDNLTKQDGQPTASQTPEAAGSPGAPTPAVTPGT